MWCVCACARVCECVRALALNRWRERGNRTHRTLNRYERVFIGLFQFRRNGSRRKFNQYYHGISERVKSLIGKILFLKNKKKTRIT
jgi:hypothetical protein